MARPSRIDVRREVPCWRHDLDVVADTQATERVRGEDATGDLLDCDAHDAWCGAQRVGATTIVTSCETAHRHMLARRKGVLAGKVTRYCEGDGDGVGRQPVDGRHLNGVKLRTPCHSEAQYGLTASNGSRHDVHRYIAWHAVEPNRLTSNVSGEPHRGQRMARATSTRCPVLAPE